MIRALLILLLFASPSYAFQNELALADPVKERQAQDIFKKIRCVVCRGESLNESNADLAVNMRGLIREKVAAGESEESISQYLVTRYGQTILQKPPVERQTYILWLLPLVLLAFGLIIIARIISRNYANSRPS